MKKKEKQIEPQQLCEICNEGNIAVAIMRNGKFSCRDCAQENPDQVLRWLK